MSTSVIWAVTRLIVCLAVRLNVISSECFCYRSDCNECGIGDVSWDAFHQDAFDEYVDEFTKLFDSYETKRAKNGALMIRSGNSGSYRFAKKG